MASEHHYLCTDCFHGWTLTAEQVLALMRMTPTCPECGSIAVSDVSKSPSR